MIEFRINREGDVEIIPETTVEAYALAKWAEDKKHWLGECDNIIKIHKTLKSEQEKL